MLSHVCPRGMENSAERRATPGLHADDGRRATRTVGSAGEGEGETVAARTVAAGEGEGLTAGGLALGSMIWVPLLDSNVVPLALLTVLPELFLMTVIGCWGLGVTLGVAEALPGAPALEAGAGDALPAAAGEGVAVLGAGDAGRPMTAL
jgi:hypothetical protein